MKKITLVVLVFAVCSAFVFQPKDEFSLEGKWVDSELQIEYEFKDNKTVYFSQMGYRVTAKYKLDKTKSPYWLDFAMETGGQALEMPGLLKIVDENTIWIEQFRPHIVHPKKFSKDSVSRERSIHILKRAQ